MGCNYYLKRKAVYDRDYEPAFTEFPEGNNKVMELDNGYVYHSHYYQTLDELNKDYYEVLHIGKSSMGWHFSLCIYPSLMIKNLDDWRREFLNPDNIIYDEYDEKLTPEEMLDKITNRFQVGYDEDPEGWEQKALESANEFEEKFGQKRVFKTYEEYMRYNHAERGLHGLWAHAGRSTFLQFIRTDGPYDLTEEVNFS